MFSSNNDALKAEQTIVVNESEQAVYKAKVYLYEMHQVVVGDNNLADNDDVIDYVKARQVSGVLLHRLALFIERLHKHGVLEQWMAEKLLHEVEHDEVALPHHLKEAIHGKDGDQRVEAAATAMAQVQKLHALYLKLMEAEGVDIRKKNLKEKFAKAKTDLKKVKHLPGQKSESDLLDVTFVPMPPSTSAQPPAPPQSATNLPPDWSASVDGNGQTYYVNAMTQQTQWSMPTA